MITKQYLAQLMTVVIAYIPTAFLAIAPTAEAAVIRVPIDHTTI